MSSPKPTWENPQQSSVQPELVSDSEYQFQFLLTASQCWASERSQGHC